MASRADRTYLGQWWWTVDRMLLVAIGAVMVSGLVLLMAGGPPVAERLGLSTFHFVNRQVAFLVPALLVMAAASFLSPRYVRRVSLVIYLVSMLLVFAALQFGPEVKGAHRWLQFGPVTIQPSEFVKPAFVVLAAWAFSEGSRKDAPGTMLAILILPATIIPLVMQPDFGQTMLITTVWAVLFFIAGLHLAWMLALGCIGAAGLAVAYALVPHVRSRVERFLDKSSGDTFQVDTALESFYQGGWFGKGPGEGTVKRILPDAHTDFIFAVTGEELGVIACMALALLFLAVVLRGLVLARRIDDPFCSYASVGLVTLFGVQAGINMGVNVHLLPAKGMTLPFISYGGSSLLSLALGMGFLVALTRRRPSAGLAGRLAPLHGNHA
ncbi:FtsW/RodA/SpoVE family cell cycle protein [Camelimonas abortus]|uniref:Probable peptidoglycan glycosyltransferase FtsW n=1 Tax=Camelimonas abortus TaxID=1017184 RepID=A0ABV7LEI7_9HYPH